MAILTPLQIGTYAHAAGVTDQRALAAAIAIAVAESAGNTRAHNATPPDDSYGLWQINMLGNLGPARRQQFGLSSNADLFDPAHNARAMAIISGKGSNFAPWTTYGGVRYRVVYPAAYAAATAVRAGRGAGEVVDDVGEAAAGPLDAIGAIGDYLGAVKDWIGERHNWTRVVLGIAGANLIILGIVMAVKDTDSVKAAVGAMTRTKGIPGGGT
jgi:hypothetical protein